MLGQRDPAGTTPLRETGVIEATELIAQRWADDAALAEELAPLELNVLCGLSNVRRLTIISAELAFQPVDELSRLLALAPHFRTLFVTVGAVNRA